MRLKKGVASRYWEDLVIAIVSGQFDVGDEICGAVISIRFQEDIISVWNRTSSDTSAKLIIQCVRIIIHRCAEQVTPSLARRGVVWCDIYLMYWGRGVESE